MSVKRALLKSETLRRRKRLGWLGWMILMVTATFLLGLGVLAWRAMTNNPTPLQTAEQKDATQTGADGISQGRTTAPLSDLVNSAQGAPAVPPKTWTVWKTKDAIGQEIWDAAPEIKAWVIRDYLDGLSWTDEHMYELEFLKNHLETYYTGKRLAEMRDIVDWEQRHNQVFAISTVKRLPLGTLVAGFSPDGTTATILDYHTAGKGQVFDLKTRTPRVGNSYPDTMHMVELTYDAASSRWKIARSVMDFDLETSKVIWREEWNHE